MAGTATRSKEFDPTANIETWEVNGDFSIWVWVKDPRQPGQLTKRRVGGNRGGGSKRLRITTDERRLNEEMIVDENAHLNPFRSGALRLIERGNDPRAKDAVDDIDEDYHWGPEQYAAFLEVRDPDIFREQVKEIDSELVMRRLYMYGEKSATMDQLQAIKDVIEERWKAGGTQRTVQEILDEEARLGRTIPGFNN